MVGCEGALAVLVDCPIALTLVNNRPAKKKLKIAVIVFITVFFEG